MHNRFFKGLALALTVATVMTSAMPVMADEIVEEVAEEVVVEEATEEVVVEEEVEAVETLSDAAVEASVSMVSANVEKRKLPTDKKELKKVNDKIAIKQNPNDTVELIEYIVKGKVKERHVSANALSENAAITLNGGVKVVVDGIVADATVSMNGKDAKAVKKYAKVAKKAKKNASGVALTLKASKAESNYDVYVSGKDKDGKDLVLKVTVDNLMLTNAKKVILYSVSKNAKGDSVSIDSVSAQKVTVSLNHVATSATGQGADMISAAWGITAAKKGVAYADVEVSKDATCVTVTPVAGKKGTVKIIANVNGKAYKASVKIADKLPKKWGKQINPCNKGNEPK